MRLREVMSAEPITVGRETPPAEVRRIMEAGRVRHLPIMDGDQLVGLWVSTDAGPVVMFGPEEVREAIPDADAVDAIAALFDDAAVVAMEAGRPVGILTRTDAMAVVRDGLAARRVAVPPLVLRLVGPAGGGKTTLLVRTVARLKRWYTGLVEANADAPADDLVRLAPGADVAHAPSAHWRKGFRRAIEQMGGVDVVFVEDRDQPPVATVGLGEDVQVIVVPVADVRTVAMDGLVEAQAVVLTKPADAPGVDVDAERARLREANPNVAVFVVGPDDDDRGLVAWQQWLEGRLIQHRR